MSENCPAEQPELAERSFDPIANINLMRGDIAAYGQVLPETLKRVRDEQLSYLAEGIDRQSHTSFVLPRGQGGELQYFDRGRWQSYTATLIKGLQTAEKEAKADPRRKFLLDMARRDLEIGYQMRALKPGERLQWTSPYNHAAEDRYGADFMRVSGFNPVRKMGFIYEAIGLEDGNVRLESQTVDQSDEEAFAAVHNAIEYEKDYVTQKDLAGEGVLDLDALRRTYDGVLYQRTGRRHYAGSTEYQRDHNAWSLINGEIDLVNYLMHELVKEAELASDAAETERRVTHLLVGVWKSFKERLSGRRPDLSRVQMPAGGVDPAVWQQMMLSYEVGQNLANAIITRDMPTGCGGSIRVELDASKVDLQGDSLETAFNKIFGDKADKAEKYSFSKLMYCVVCQAPPKAKGEAKKMCGPCGICRGCDGHLQAKNKGLLAIFGS